jgi:hypothetical protein
MIIEAKLSRGCNLLLAETPVESAAIDWIMEGGNGGRSSEMQHAGPVPAAGGTARGSGEVEGEEGGTSTEELATKI